jgi:Protein of unknown function (DUF5818)
MRRISLAILSLILLLTLGFAQKNRAATFTGEIMDSQCAGMDGHEMMMKDENAKDAKDCTIKCVHDGGKYVLYDSKAKSTYTLDDQAKAKEFAGQKVKVSGTLDKNSSTIHVSGISPAS